MLSLTSVHSAPTQAFLDMPATCRTSDSDSWTCAAVYHWTGNETLAHGATWLIGKPLAILVILLVAVVVRWLASKAIDRVVRRAENASLGAGRVGHNRRAARARSLGSLLKSITTTVVFGIAAVMILDELGMNVAPILASAGVLGLAIGFGAQNLVKDFLSGVMMMVEDQYGVGDEVDLGEAIGTVEHVALRVTRVRDVNGTVWYVRNGEILRVGNSSQNWARTVLDVNVSYDQDLRKVREVLQDVAHGLWDDEDYKDVILEEPEVWGVQALNPDWVTVRVTLKTAPLKQWGVAREMRERIKARFDHEGISMQVPQRLFWQQGPGQVITPDGAPE
ncbi:mechanosensitive ion channel family protein [Marmoricola sp. URHB0036]|uniref:mechanosensitive ion channel family protein n=1 Tax=Marmoricola sp. URHB0036 TaxID=1298863 RepID=UPI00041C7792|nr:mechanosensitive ion channel family protein [Marmoricola sp. URHB0036]